MLCVWNSVCLVEHENISTVIWNQIQFFKCCSADVPLQLTGELELEVLWLKSADPGRPPLLPWWPYVESEALWQDSSSNNSPEMKHWHTVLTLSNPFHSLSLSERLGAVTKTHLWPCGSGLLPLCSSSCWWGPGKVTDGLEWNSELYGPDLGLRTRGKITN